MKLSKASCLAATGLLVLLGVAPSASASFHQSRSNTSGNSEIGTSGTSGTSGAGPAGAVLGTYADAINALGMSAFPSVYAADATSADGAVTVYVGPGSTQALQSAIANIDLSKVADPPVNPAIHLSSVPASIGTLDTASAAVGNGAASLASLGYSLDSTTPDVMSGTLDVTFSSAPANANLASATILLQDFLSTAAADPAAIGTLKVTNLDDPPVPAFAANRYADVNPWSGGDLIGFSKAEGSSGFSVKNTYGVARMLTAAHLGKGTFYNFAADGTTRKSKIGSTLEYYLGNRYDVQTVGAASGTTFSPTVWGGPQGDTNPPLYSVGGPLSGYPSMTANLVFDGAASGEQSGATIKAEGPGTCRTFYISESPGTMYVCNLIQTTNSAPSGPLVARPGDSGGPVFETGYLASQGLVTPAALIVGGSTAVGGSVYSSFIGADLSQTGTTIYRG